MDDLELGAIKDVLIGGADDDADMPVVAGRLHGGAPFALAPSCSWCTSALSAGLILGGSVTCCTCFSSFDAHTGAVLAGPALGALRAYQTTTKAGRLIIAPPTAADLEASVEFSDAGTSAIAGAVLERAQDEDDSERTVVIAGGGAAGAAAALELRALGFQGAVIVVCAEDALPYDRTALSKRPVGDAGELELRPEVSWQNLGVEVMLGTTLQDIDSSGRIAGLSDGRALTYDSLLLCPGAVPRSLPGVGEGSKSVFVLRTAADAAALQARLDASETPLSVAVAGSGLLGVEVAAMLCRDRARVSAVSLVGVSQPTATEFGPEVAASVADWLSVEGPVDVRPPALINAVEEGVADGSAVSIVLDSGDVLDADLAVLAVGSDPNTGFLADVDAITLDTEGAIVVDEHMRAARNIYAAGEAAAGPTAPRCTHWASAVAQGQAAARSIMSSAPSSARGAEQQPTYALQLFGLPIQAVGYVASDYLLDGELTTDAEHGDRPNATLYYHDGVEVTGVLCVDRPAQAAAAAKLFALGRFPALADIDGGEGGLDLVAVAVEAAADESSGPRTAEDAEAEEREATLQQLRLAIDDIDRTGSGFVASSEVAGICAAAGLELDDEEQAEVLAFLCETPATRVATEDLLRWWVS